MLEIIIEFALTGFIWICFIGFVLNTLSDCFEDIRNENHETVPNDMVPRENFDRLLEILRKRTLKLKRLRREVRQHHKACQRYKSDKEHLRIYLED